jgi:hypothetical protein
LANLFALALPDSAAALLVTYGAGALIRVQSSPTEAGSYGDVVTIPIVSGVSVYPVYDPDGVAGSYYKYRYEASDGDPAGTYSAAFQPVAGQQGLYASSAELKHYARIPDDDTVDDAELALALDTASRLIDKACRRQFGKVSSSATRTYTARWSRSWQRYIVEIDDIYDDDVVTVTSDGTAVTNFVLEPRNAEADGKPYTTLMFGSGVTISCLRNGIAVTSTRYGWLAVPSAIKNATLLQASRIVKRRDSPFGIAGSPDMGNEMRLLARLDPDVAVMVKPYYRWWAAA